MTTYRIADLFCGAGGSTTGAYRAVAALGAELDLVAVNHWDVAIATHSRNHPAARHACVNLDAARPEDLVPDGRLDLLMASPECVHFSRARGGRPVHDQRRMSAWHVQRWATALDIGCILVENVAEFREWGPLTAEGRPDKARKGLYFQAWVKALWELGYTVDWRLLNAADYGDATTRVRLFVQARKDGRPIVWPEPTHSASGDADLFGGRPRWRAAREVIDWQQPGRSLFARKKPLSLQTRQRIARGLSQFGGVLAPYFIALLDLPDAPPAAAHAGEGPQPFVLANRAHNTPRGEGEPVPTITTAGGGGLMTVTPEARPFGSAPRNHTAPRSLDEPMPTIVAANGSGGMALVEPVASFVLGQQSMSAPRATEAEPLPTIATAGAIALVTGTAEPAIVPYYGTGVADSVDEPLATVTTRARFGLYQPMVVPYHGAKDGVARAPRTLDEPLATVTTEPRFALCTPGAEPFVVPQFGEAPGQQPRVHDLAAPLPAVTSHGAGALVNPLLVQVNHDDPRAQSVDDALPTITASRGVALVEPAVSAATGDVDPRRLVRIGGVLHQLDIRFRMLTNRELALAMGFEGYEFTGNVGEVTRQIGNAVAVGTAAALVQAILQQA